MVEAQKLASSDVESDSDSDLDSSLCDQGEQLMLINDEESGNLLSGLQWKDGAGAHLRKAYHGTGRSTVFARKAMIKARQQTMKVCRPLTSYFARQPSKDSNHSPERQSDVSEENTINGDSTTNEPSVENDCNNDFQDDELEASLEAAIHQLRDIVKLNNNSAQEQRNRHSKFDHIRFLCILRFLELIQQHPRSRVESSREIAATVYGRATGGEYKARCIRMWSDEFLHSRILMPLRQGKHQKSSSLLDDPDIKQACLQFLRTRRVELIDGASFSEWVSNELHKVESLALVRPARITERTARRWLNRLGFQHQEYRKGTYTDGHERPDVVEYRIR